MALTESVSASETRIVEVRSTYYLRSKEPTLPSGSVHRPRRKSSIRHHAGSSGQS